MPGRHRFRRRVDGDAQPAYARAQAQIQSWNGGGDAVPDGQGSRDNPPRAPRDGRGRLQGAEIRLRCCQAPRPRASADQRTARDGRQRLDQGAGHPLHQQADAGQAAEAHLARAARHRGRRSGADHPRPVTRRRRLRRRVLFPRLRLGAAVLAGGPRYTGDALSRRRTVRAAAGVPVLRLSADRRRQESKGRRSSPTTACCSTASRTRSTTSTSRR